jgi:succinate-semialdehyde dehydrogenase/glutarate-semialdehyde dehydrogenase
MKSVNPATAELLKEYQEHSAAEANHVIEDSYRAFLSWKNFSFSERSQYLKRVALVLQEGKNDLGKLISLEMGKPISEAIAEIEKCAWVSDYYAAQAVNFLKNEPAQSDGKEAYISFEPLGPILAIMPWNFPFWQVFRFAAPALMAGNSALLKHASNVSGCALAIEEVFLKAGLPKNLFRTLLISSAMVQEVIENDLIMAVTLTGSEAAGSKVAEIAGRSIKKCVLELGGSDPFIILKDAELAKAVQSAVRARCLNAGQSCIAAKRFIVEKSIVNEFEKLFVRALGQLKMGDPLDPATEVGALAREDIRSELHGQVERSIDGGGKLILGGNIPDGKGFFYPVTLIRGDRAELAVFKEETFGPVAALIAVENEDQAITIANNSRLGLGASLWTRDIEKGKKIASMIECGSVFINGMVKSDPRLPFGGIKKSGFGRELSHYGIKEFVNIKTVWVG